MINENNLSEINSSDKFSFLYERFIEIIRINQRGRDER